MNKLLLLLLLLILVVIILVVLFLLFFGGTNSNAIPVLEGVNKPGAPPIGNTCSNSEYSTVVKNATFTSYIGETNHPIIALSTESLDKFGEKVHGIGTFQEGLRGIADLKCLEHLGMDWVDETEEDNYDLTPIAGLTNLKRLALVETPIRDITPLSGMTEMQALYLTGTYVSDLTPLKNMKKLRELDISTYGRPNIDPSIFSGMIDLELLSAYSSDLPEEECQLLKQMLPKLRDCYYEFFD